MKAPLLLLLVGPFLSPVSPQEPALEDLAWLAGHWSAEEGGVLMEEHWTAPRGGVLLGLHRDVRLEGNELLGFEYLRIVVDGEGVPSYVASPGGGSSTSFSLAELEERRVVFENLEHDFPQRVVYRREGDVLLARVEDAAGERGLQWRWELED